MTKLTKSYRNVATTDACFCVVWSSVKDPGDAEISKLDQESSGDEYVLCLDVPVEDVPTVDVLDGEADLKEDEEDKVLTEVFPPLSGDEREEVTTSTELHDDLQEVLPVEGLLVEHDVRVLHVWQKGHLP